MAKGGRKQDARQEKSKSRQEGVATKPLPCLFANFSCEQVEYRVNISLDKFNLDAFKKAFFESIRQPLEEDAASGDAVGATRDHTLTDYHVHFSWHVRKEMFRLRLEYFRGLATPDLNDEGPFAENFMPWLGQFFMYKQAEAHIHSTFSYLKRGFQTILPIPMTIPVEAKEFSEVEVFGMSTYLKTKPLGVHTVFQSLHEDKIMISLAANRSVAFEGYDLNQELAELSSVARMFIREAKA